MSTTHEKDRLRDRTDTIKALLTINRALTVVTDTLLVNRTIKPAEELMECTKQLSSHITTMLERLERELNDD